MDEEGIEAYNSDSGDGDFPMDDISDENPARGDPDNEDERGSARVDARALPPLPRASSKYSTHMGLQKCGGPPTDTLARATNSQRHAEANRRRLAYSGSQRAEAPPQPC